MRQGSCCDASFWLAVSLTMGIAATSVGADAAAAKLAGSAAGYTAADVRVGNVTLEMSLKPFRSMEEEFIASTCRELFRQWWPLTRHADTVSVLLWTADGSEILTYKGRRDDEIEWARYIGNPNARPPAGADPGKLSLHQQAHLYTDDPPVITYGRLADIVRNLKQVGAEINGKPIRVGATFDPGPEFAKSPFKYEKHPEICLGNTMGKATFVCCYSTLNKDDEPYAGFPDGIPQNTPFGTFLGRQCRHFLGDLGFDYIWFSNGFGFGVEAWGATGAVFDGREFHTDKIGGVRDKILQFWRTFREECPDFPIETRGTNLAAGMDLSSDGVPVRDIYRGGFNMMPPPNSPWAAINGDFGLELVGYMSHIAEIPGSDYPVRFYIHDPWWLNSPWLDRYGREPHDIYLPMSVARITADGQVQPASSIDFLTVDNSLGEMPTDCPAEVIPHILRARADAPDQPGPIMWLYPFDEYHDFTFRDSRRVGEVFFGDWFMRQAVNHGFPLNTVVSTANFLGSRRTKPELYCESVLVSIVPDGGTDLEQALLDTGRRGGKVLLYGPIGSAGPELLAALNLARAEPVHGEFSLDLRTDLDRLSATPYPKKVHQRPLTCAGGVRAALADVADSSTHIQALIARDDDRRIIALSRKDPQWNGGVIAWVRGTNSNFYRKGAPLLATDNPADHFPGELLMRYALSAFGYEFAVGKNDPGQKDPVVCVARRRNGFFFSGFNPDTTVMLHLRLPQGAPLLLGLDTRLVDGRSTYTMGTAWHRECRVFVDQPDEGELSCRELPSVQYGIRRRFLVTGLENAAVRFYHDPAVSVEDVSMFVNSRPPYTTGRIQPRPADDSLGRYLLADNLSGRLVIAW